MKKIIMASLVIGTLMSCANEANDGDASTDTTTFDATPGDTSSAPLGDTSLDLNNQGTLSNPNTRTDVDTSHSAGSTRDTGTGSGSTNRP
jgi:hypothetical protein